MRVPRQWLPAVLGVILTACATGPEEAPDEWPRASLEHADAELLSGRDVVRRSMGFMSNLEALQFESRVTYEVSQDSGQRLSFDMWHRMKIRKPDRLFWMTLHDNAVTDSAWFFEGKFTLLKQPANIWGRIDVPSTIPEAIDRLVTEYAVPVPFADLLMADPEEFWLGDHVLSVENVGEAYIDGLWTHHVSIRKPGVDMEMWVRKGEQPFPVRLTFRLLDEPGQPSHSARFFGWSTSVSPEDIPPFSPPPNSDRIEVVPIAR